MKGCLREHVSFWEHELSAPPWVIDTIKHGLILPLRTEPTLYNRPNQLSATSNSQWVDDAITGLVRGQYILEVRKKPQICSPLSASWCLPLTLHLVTIMWKLLHSIISIWVYNEIAGLTCWRNRGLKYLNDGVFTVHGAKEANEASQLVQDTLVKAGLLANDEKSVWVPSLVVA